MLAYGVLVASEEERLWTDENRRAIEKSRSCEP